MSSAWLHLPYVSVGISWPALATLTALCPSSDSFFGPMHALTPLTMIVHSSLSWDASRSPGPQLKLSGPHEAPSPPLVGSAALRRVDSARLPWGSSWGSRSLSVARLKGIIFHVGGVSLPKVGGIGNTAFEIGSMARTRADSRVLVGVSDCEILCALNPKP